MSDEIKENSETMKPEAAAQLVVSLSDLITAAGGSEHESDEQPLFSFAYRHAITEELIGFFDFRALSAKVNRKFQDLAVGTIKSKPNRAEAVKHVFEHCCIRFRLADENARLELGKWASAKALFANEPKLEMVVEQVVNEYLGVARPNIEDAKK